MFAWHNTQNPSAGISSIFYRRSFTKYNTGLKIVSFIGARRFPFFELECVQEIFLWGGKKENFVFVAANNARHENVAGVMSSDVVNGEVMKLNYERALFFTAGVVVGVGVVCFVKSKAGKKTAVAIASKGLELKNRVVSMTERVKEAVDDVMAEAKYVNEQKAQTD
jgi:hypothetical protein